MLICAKAQDARNARIAPLDQLLVEHPTEYHYLFKLLHSFKSGRDDPIVLSHPERRPESAGDLPGVPRSVKWEFYKKLGATNSDENKKTAIFKFANDLSHRTGKGFDPALVAETQKNAAYLLEMIKAVAPLHYQGLEKLATA